MHALHYAVLSGNEELVELLVSLGGDRAAGIANGDGLYPLHMACSKGMAKAAAALCKIEGVKEVRGILIPLAMKDKLLEVFLSDFGTLL